MRRLILTLALLAAAGAARGEIIDAQPGGFQVKQTALIKAPPETVWKTLVQPAAWWNTAHTFSGDARNLVL
jgi:hypothetical protein